MQKRISHVPNGTPDFLIGWIYFMARNQQGFIEHDDYFFIYNRFGKW